METDEIHSIFCTKIMLNVGSCDCNYWDYLVRIIGHIGGEQCHCQREMWTNAQNSIARASTDVCVAIGETTESQGHVYTTVAGKS